MIAVSGPGAYVARLPLVPGASLEDVEPLPSEPLLSFAVVPDRDGGWIAIWRELDGGAIAALFARDGARVEGVVHREASRWHSVAPDRLVGGALVLTLCTDGPRLDRVRLEGGVAVSESAIDRARLPTDLDPDVQLVSNQTEAIFPLASGAMAFVPIRRDEVRILAPPVPAPASALRVYLADGTSNGGQAWCAEGGLWYRALVCNR
jgi:hypothetical protein